MKISSFGLSTAEIREELAPLRSDFSIAICRAKNPFNIGAIIRTAHSFLAKEIFLIGSEPYYERAAMGMQKYENIVEHPDEATFLAAVAGRHLIGVERDHARQTLWESPFPSGLVFLFGSENDGLSPELLVACHDVIAIPMYGINHSYPVAIAAGMIMCEWARRKDPRARA
ncbi:TrmH family RNA methyltransferase [Chondromyces apiculatus]|uniref:tRNA/rRNA methyltransferase (SpoU) n=1 Tax=Chondromyces apiculatus DSM 436 TaxID=1192034 RepID=A0A017TJZ3_9BACT|nr:TrmH family RNA methyltransferase [Chondromyces apiculatus]EYF08971.1 tRNA/rRNA methyltransferase (SpoU) [Chondromyces apiculatus DSM 436]